MSYTDILLFKYLCTSQHTHSPPIMSQKKRGKTFSFLFFLHDFARQHGQHEAKLCKVDYIQDEKEKEGKNNPFLYFLALLTGLKARNGNKSMTRCSCGTCSF